jgi:uncharacterized protein YijF (DUF1287 family)
MRNSTESPRPDETIAAAAKVSARANEDRATLFVLLAPILAITVAVGALQVPAQREIVRAQAMPLSPSKAVLEPLASTALMRAVPPVAAATLEPTTTQTRGPLEAIAPTSTPPVLIAAGSAQRDVGRCILPARAAASLPPKSLTPAEFGRRLANAAAAQTLDLVVYSEGYRQIRYPMGDVSPLYGVCTDVVVRAYRALGIDLQVLVHRAKLGTGDSSIDHRRVGTLRRFFAQYGDSLPTTDFVEDYRPGDIVTYSRPSGRGSQLHIAVVADRIAPSGRPMIVHNRGWGPLIEDALFARDITGHYRFTADQAAAAAVAQAAPPPASKVEQKSVSASDTSTPKSDRATR